ncbi:MAG: hypothetical protein PHD15_03065 [Clostridia bacterium]|nr:hypothetical protein [Clostridia bacterium]MDD4386726.1 hypothetical protein [Clostridia bacterium]
MCYFDEIKKMMRISKETNESVIAIFNEETILVKYYEQFEDYTFQYSWIITEEDSVINQNVSDELNNFLIAKSGYAQITPKIDLIQIGLISICNTEYKEFIEIITLAKKKKMEQTRDTKYVFFGKKVLRVIQYCGKFSNPFECMDNISKWNNQAIEHEIESRKLIKFTRGIYCIYSKENDSITFSIGCKYIRTVFRDEISETIPPLICIDSIKGITEYNIKDYVK